MVVCPKCHKIIERLEQVRTGVEKSNFFIDVGGLATCDGENFESDGDFLEYRCWECSEVLFEDWDEAEEFLKNKDELQEIVAEKISQNEKNKIK